MLWLLLIGFIIVIIFIAMMAVGFVIYLMMLFMGFAVAWVIGYYGAVAITHDTDIATACGAALAICTLVVIVKYLGQDEAKKKA